MIKLPIGIIDESLEGINTVAVIKEIFPYEDFVYINDFANTPYEGNRPEDILELVKKNVNILLKQKIKALIVISDVIYEYCLDYLRSLPVPVVFSVEAMINYANNNYEYKNMVLLAKTSIIQTNIYQKNLRHNHIYSLAADNLGSLIECKKIKTMTAFTAVSDVLKALHKKDVNILIPSIPYLTMLYTEINEYLLLDEMLDPGRITALALKELLPNPYFRKRGKVVVYSSLDKKIFTEKCNWINFKYKYFLINPSEDA